MFLLTLCCKQCFWIAWAGICLVCNIIQRGFYFTKGEGTGRWIFVFHFWGRNSGWITFCTKHWLFFLNLPLIFFFSFEYGVLVIGIQLVEVCNVLTLFWEVYKVLECLYWKCLLKKYQNDRKTCSILLDVPLFRSVMRSAYGKFWGLSFIAESPVFLALNTLF